MGEVALSILVLSLVAVIGLWLGGLKIKGVGLGIGGVLFGGIFVGHFINQFGWHLDSHAMHFIKEFGLILFVYTIGIQVGPGFFASLKSSGLKLNGLAAGIVVVGGLTAVILHFIFNIPLHIFLGIYSGAVTNTPSLAAGQQILHELGEVNSQVDMLGLGYAMAYPFGIIGILLSMWIIRIVFEINVDKEAESYDSRSLGKGKDLLSVNVMIDNPNMDQMKFAELVTLIGQGVVCSRMKTQGNLVVPGDDTTLHIGDYLHFVSDRQELLHKAVLIVGREVSESLSTKGTVLKSDRVVVTNEKVLGKHLGELSLKYKHNVVISRLNRSGVELVASQDSVLQFGDILYIVGQKEDIEYVGKMLGNTASKLHHVQMLPIFIGIGLGVLLGSIPFQLPHLPAPLKLGLAGGPLIVAIILARIGSIGRLYWFMPPSANLALREIGIVLFLAVVGISSGGNFFTTIMDGEGLTWMGYGIIITLVPLISVGMFARFFGKVNYLTICGLMAGSMTDPPALAFANAMHATSGASSLAYATVYPLVMCLRILTPQVIAVLLWVTG
ncbi:putative transporter [Vibrio gazogenes]|uniref:Putative transport protein n=1 Tax=Vibrio gazogenes DSM 21264 = NBRC 103151 TaxID=1123492 RepID=A0A1M5CBV6_VIBGA|nr:putative transporter [Vibrio gazogenes]USP16252.1 putative transporter [Vibrio gazogenes]SHF52156.1 putative transport protein [Vibrio gazogenes DSM 21264] [Vibrio gazogenes DSM 21264 = NBRC 103151]SJN53193.1 Aspartate/alanine antiporter [Vibrio gazogenes]